MLWRCLGIGAGIGLLLGALAGPDTDTGTGILLVVLGGLLGCGVGGLVAVGLDIADVQLPEISMRASGTTGRPAPPEPVVVEDDLGPIVPAGWYPDPAGGAEKRYWDGERWG